MSNVPHDEKKPFGLRGVLAVCGLVAILGVVAAIVWLPPSAWLQGTKIREKVPTEPIAENRPHVGLKDRWTLAASSPSNATESLGGHPLGTTSNAAQHAWLLVQGQLPPKSLAQQAITDNPNIDKPQSDKPISKASTSSQAATDGQAQPDRLQPAALFHVPPTQVGSSIAPGTARAIAVFPIAPDAIAAWGNQLALAFVDRPRVPIEVPGGKKPPAPVPPKMTSVASYQVIERGDAGGVDPTWMLDGASGSSQTFPALPAARPVLGLAFASPLGDGTKQVKPTLFALVGPAIDVPARDPLTELLMAQDTSWVSLGQPWLSSLDQAKLGAPKPAPVQPGTEVAPASAPSDLVPHVLATVPGGVALLMRGSREALVALLPTTATQTSASSWLTLQEDDDWVIGQPSNSSTGADGSPAGSPPSPSVPQPGTIKLSAQPVSGLVARVTWHKVALPQSAGTPTQLQWAGDQVLVLMQTDDASDAGSMQVPEGKQPPSHRIYRARAGDFVASPDQAGFTQHAPTWALLSEQTLHGAPWLVGIPGSARIGLWWSSDADALGGVKPQSAVQISLATGLEFSQGPLAIVPPTGGADIRFVAGTLAYLLGIVAVLLVPKPSRGSLVLPKDAAMASPLRRFTAGLIDLSIAVVMGSFLAGQSPGEVVTSRVVDVLFTHEGQEVLLVILGTAVVFNASLESLTGRSIGKFFLGIGVARLVPGTKTHITSLTPGQGVSDSAIDQAAQAPHERGDASPSIPLNENTFLAPALHRSLVRNLVKWCLFPLGFIAALRPGASHAGDELAQCAVIDPAPLDDDEFED